MDILSIRHKPLRRLFETGNGRGLNSNLIERLRKMLFYIAQAADFDELTIPPNYGLHALAGNREGYWAMTVTRNWRLTFTKIDDCTLGNLDLEDYH